MHNTWILDPCLSGVGGSAQRNGVMRSVGKSCQWWRCEVLRAIVVFNLGQATWRSRIKEYANANRLGMGGGGEEEYLEAPWEWDSKYLGVNFMCARECSREKQSWRLDLMQEDHVLLQNSYVRRVVFWPLGIKTYLQWTKNWCMWLWWSTMCSGLRLRDCVLNKMTLIGRLRRNNRWSRLTLGGWTPRGKLSRTAIKLY